MLHYFHNLNFLSLADNKITHSGIYALTEKFCDLGELEVLELHVNPFDQESCILLASNMKLLKKLKILFLDECEISGNGLLDILNSLTELKNLERASLDYSYFTDKANDSMIAIVHKLKNLKRMSLRHSGITTNTQEILVQAYPNILFSF